MAECIDSVSFAFFLFFLFFSPLLFNTLCFATPLYFSTDTFHIILPFFFSLLPYKKNLQTNKKTNTDGVKRSQTDSVITKYQHSTSYTFGMEYDHSTCTVDRALGMLALHSIATRQIEIIDSFYLKFFYSLEVHGKMLVYLVPVPGCCVVSDFIVSVLLRRWYYIDGHKM